MAFDRFKSLLFSMIYEFPKFSHKTNRGRTISSMYGSFSATNSNLFRLSNHFCVDFEFISMSTPPATETPQSLTDESFDSSLFSPISTELHRLELFLCSSFLGPQQGSIVLWPLKSCIQDTQAKYHRHSLAIVRHKQELHAASEKSRRLEEAALNLRGLFVLASNRLGETEFKLATIMTHLGQVKTELKAKIEELEASRPVERHGHSDSTVRCVHEVS